MKLLSFLLYLKGVVLWIIFKNRFEPVKFQISTQIKIFQVRFLGGIIYLELLSVLK